MAKTISIEEALKRLDELTVELAKNDISLDESFRLYNEGLKLVKICNDQLDKVEKKIIILEEEDADEH
ncbi:MAG: exodeoxyribonuclease VII small subunit [Lachnospiraceae bacterium]|uniref:exodeoxyribonuclease VII small subunit n=1 Tax=Falcatimonas sp. MSJ-15 TaxID=2841515 RepID=UPI001C110A50|nr:exodeoxyribonuclease VII small subunit [Falcatimonas sp. MSJ-15]MBQ5735983.1 exodeoxyribonuclease VII small subunit [Lachnospiraceae bacterium]MBU5471477.1 exodeoxyribonuclease VII small subunit [Falcatimonas sp. MSJ-15]MEE0958982.1 exodeoxyribonuclease VII small subunit [Lachnospiraceae bacterium]